MSSRDAVLALAVAFALTLAGCGEAASPRPAVSSDDAKARALQVQADGLRNLLMEVPVRLSREPVGDAPDGTFLCRLLRVSTEASATTVTVDFLTDAFDPNATPAQRHSSAWPDVWGWNKTTHPQSFRVTDYATLAVIDEDGPLVVSTSDLAKHNSDPNSKLLHFVTVANGEVAELWPWRP